VDLEATAGPDLCHGGLGVGGLQRGVPRPMALWWTALVDNRAGRA